MQNQFPMTFYLEISKTLNRKIDKYMKLNFKIVEKSVQPLIKYLITKIVPVQKETKKNKQFAKTVSCTSFGSPSTICVQRKTRSKIRQAAGNGNHLQCKDIHTTYLFAFEGGMNTNFNLLHKLLKKITQICNGVQPM